MSALSFVWDMHQSGQIDELDERLKRVESDSEYIKQWINYLNERHLENLETISKLEQIIRSNYEQSGRTNETCGTHRPEGNKAEEDSQTG